MSLLGDVWTLVGNYSLLILAAVIVFSILGIAKAASQRAGEHYGLAALFALVFFVGLFLVFLGWGQFGWFVTVVGLVFLVVALLAGPSR
ncbi:MAG: hypothetical protein L3K00_03135 [Thermoplasmata archaeon]|nr:hypothetical protein [Thermoplasmata archaeon]